MTLRAAAGRLAERVPLPDGLTRLAIARRVARTRGELADAREDAGAVFAAAMAAEPVARSPDIANRQHYELPPEFFGLVLGPHRKYSSGLYPNDTATLAEAEECALAATAEHADLADGQTILELGCGWGSLSLWLAERFPDARITAVSNSAPQREYIAAAAARRRLGNLRLLTADMNIFDPVARFDRVVSVEMFEHIANWRLLLERIRGWLGPDGLLFLHVFSHRLVPYAFDDGDPEDWIARHFFTGGIMPSHGLIRHFGDIFTVEAEWRWSGAHYQRTAQHWLANYDRNLATIRPLLAAVYGRDAALWQRRWRLFFLATAGLFGDRGGSEWGVSHYRLRPMARDPIGAATSF